ncbi:MAG: hypothetical protein JW854_08895 [Actinobacteria bacterium]|nr:hypothetical protein [Actinomycetota bacterium]
MRKKILFALTIAVIFTVGFMSGCGGCGCNGEHELYNYPEHEFEEEEKEDYSTSTVLPTEDEMGVPVYNDNLDPSTVESSKTETDGEVTDVGVDYSTKDDFETVVSWYKNELGEPKEFQQLPDGSYQTWWNLEKDGMSIQVIVSGKEDGTAISILKSKI